MARQVTLFQFAPGCNKPLKAMVMRPDCTVDFVESTQGIKEDPLATVHIRGLGDILIISQHAGDPEPIPPTTSPLGGRAVPFLKSHIQKAVRRMNWTAAKQAVLTLLYIDHEALWRRLPIIMVEDTRVTDDFKFLVFGMVASATKRWTASRQVVSRLMAVVHAMAAAPAAETLTFRDRVPSIPEVARIASDRHRSLAWALLARHQYGGMGGDKRMLAGFVDAQCHGADGWAPGEPVDDIDANTRPRFIVAADQCLLCAVDFHCYPMILEKFAGQRGTPDEVKKLMWDGSSGYNLRRPESMTTPYPLLKLHHEEARKFLARLFANHA